MLCSLIRNKLVALWIGTAGVGVISLYNATLDMIKCMTLFNLRQGSVPKIAGETDPERQAMFCRHVELTSLIVGAIASVLVLVLSPFLSFFTFDSFDYTWGFALLAPTMLITSLGDARCGVLQGLGKLRALARVSLYSVALSTALAIPLFYFFRMAAIVPVLILFPLLVTVFAFLMPEGRLKYPPHDRELFRATMKSLLRLGSFLALGLAFGFIADYLLRVYLSYEGGVDTVGIFQAGYMIIKSYVGVFFTAITMEFFPRLSATINSRRFTSVIVSYEIGMSLWILMPLVVLFVAFGDLVVWLLYSSDFMDAVPYVTIAIIATVLRAVSWCFSYVILAKGDGKIYLLTEGISAVSLLAFSYFGWRMGGYEGLGWAYVGQFVAFTIATWAIFRWRYKLRLSSKVGVLLAFALAISLGASVLKIWFGWWSPLMLLVPIGVVRLLRR